MRDISKTKKLDTKKEESIEERKRKEEERELLRLAKVGALIVLLLLIATVNVLEEQRLRGKLEGMTLDKVEYMKKERGVISIGKKVVNIYQLGEKGNYENAKDRVYDYLSKEMKETYFPSRGERAMEVLEKSVIKIKGAGVRDIGGGEHEVVVDFIQKRGNIEEKHKVEVKVKSGKIYGISPVY